MESRSGIIRGVRELYGKNLSFEDEQDRIFQAKDLELANQVWLKNTKKQSKISQTQIASLIPVKKIEIKEQNKGYLKQKQSKYCSQKQFIPRGITDLQRMHSTDLESQLNKSGTFCYLNMTDAANISEIFKKSTVPRSQEMKRDQENHKQKTNLNVRIQQFKYQKSKENKYDQQKDEQPYSVTRITTKANNGGYKFDLDASDFIISIKPAVFKQHQTPIFPLLLEKNTNSYTLPDLYDYFGQKINTSGFNSSRQTITSSNIQEPQIKQVIFQKSGQDFTKNQMYISQNEVIQENDFAYRKEQQEESSSPIIKKISSLDTLEDGSQFYADSQQNLFSSQFKQNNQLSFLRPKKAQIQDKNEQNLHSLERRQKAQTQVLKREIYLKKSYEKDVYFHEAIEAPTVMNIQSRQESELFNSHQQKEDTNLSRVLSEERVRDSAFEKHDLKHKLDQQVHDSDKNTSLKTQITLISDQDQKKHNFIKQDLLVQAYQLQKQNDPKSSIFFKIKERQTNSLCQQKFSDKLAVKDLSISQKLQFKRDLVTPIQLQKYPLNFEKNTTQTLTEKQASLVSTKTNFYKIKNLQFNPIYKPDQSSNLETSQGTIQNTLQKFSPRRLSPTYKPKVLPEIQSKNTSHILKDQHNNFISNYSNLQSSLQLNNSVLIRRSDQDDDNISNSSQTETNLNNSQKLYQTFKSEYNNQSMFKTKKKINSDLSIDQLIKTQPIQSKIQNQNIYLNEPTMQVHKVEQLVDGGFDTITFNFKNEKIQQNSEGFDVSQNDQKNNQEYTKLNQIKVLNVSDTKTLVSNQINETVRSQIKLDSSQRSDKTYDDVTSNNLQKFNTDVHIISELLVNQNAQNFQQFFEDKNEEQSPKKIQSPNSVINQKINVSSLGQMQIDKNKMSLQKKEHWLMQIELKQKRNSFQKKDDPNQQLNNSVESLTSNQFENEGLLQVKRFEKPKNTINITNLGKTSYNQLTTLTNAGNTVQSFWGNASKTSSFINDVETQQLNQESLQKPIHESFRLQEKNLPQNFQDQVGEKFPKNQTDRLLHSQLITKSLNSTGNLWVNSIYNAQSSYKKMREENRIKSEQYLNLLQLGKLNKQDEKKPDKIVKKKQQSKQKAHFDSLQGYKIGVMNNKDVFTHKNFEIKKKAQLLINILENNEDHYNQQNETKMTLRQYLSSFSHKIAPINSGVSSVLTSELDKKVKFQDDQFQSGIKESDSTFKDNVINQEEIINIHSRIQSSQDSRKNATSLTFNSLDIRKIEIDKKEDSHRSLQIVDEFQVNSVINQTNQQHDKIIVDQIQFQSQKKKYNFLNDQNYQEYVDQMLYPKNVADILRNLCAKIEKIHKLEQIEYTDNKNSTISQESILQASESSIHSSVMLGQHSEPDDSKLLKLPVVFDKLIAGKKPLKSLSVHERQHLNQNFKYELALAQTKKNQKVLQKVCQSDYMFNRTVSNYLQEFEKILNSKECQDLSIQDPNFKQELQKILQIQPSDYEGLVAFKEIDFERIQGGLKKHYMNNGRKLQINKSRKQNLIQENESIEKFEGEFQLKKNQLLRLLEAFINYFQEKVQKIKK